MNTKSTFVGGMLAGATLMFLLEPSARRRRAIVRDKTVSAARKIARFSAKASRDLANRAAGAVAEIRGRLGEERPTGQILAERVRSHIGRVVSDPGAIAVLVNEGGRVTLRGPVLADELDDLLAAAGKVRGVDEVVNRMDVHQSAGKVPALQGRARRPGVSGWSPAARLISGLAAGTVAVFAFARRVA